MLVIIASTPNFAIAQTSSQEEASREEDLFGSSDDATETPNALADIEHKIKQADHELAWGGFLFLQLNYTLPKNSALDTQRLSSPSLLDLFMDARPDPRVRAYARARLNYDLTLPDVAQNTMTQDLVSSVPNLLGLRNQSATSMQLDQLWVKFDLAQSLFLTIGRQRIRWGSNRFFNPTDFLNAAQINPIALFDARLGVDLIKLHMPLERLGWNLYMIAILGQATTLEDIGSAIRAELLIMNAELALSFVARRHIQPGPTPLRFNANLPPLWAPKEEWPRDTIPLRFGAELSAPLGPIDIHLDVAATYGSTQPFYRGDFDVKKLVEGNTSDLDTLEEYTRAQEVILQASAGFEWIINYNDQDQLVLTGEYAYNDAGYDNSELYPWLLLQSSFSPLRMGKHYIAGAIMLPNPGALEDTQFVLSTLANLSDRSALSRIDITTRIAGTIQYNISGSMQYGQQGEFHLELEVPDPENLGSLITIPATEFTLNTGLRMSF